MIDLIKNNISLSKEQKGILTTQLMNLQNPLFNYGIAFKVYPIDDINNFVNDLINIVPILSSIIKKEVLYLTGNIPVTYSDESLDLLKIQSLIDGEMDEAININDQTLSKILYYKTKNNFDILFFKIHHLIFDGLSVNLLVNTVHNLLEKKPTLDIDIYDHTQTIKNPNKKTLEYWRSKIALISNDDTFDTAIIRSGNSERVRYLEKTLNSKLIDDISEKIQSKNISISQYFIACLGILNKLYGNSQFRVGIPLNLRPAKANIIGCEMNVVPFITSIENEDVYSYMNRIKKEIFLMYRNKNISILEIQELSNNSKMPYNVTLSIMINDGSEIPNNVTLYSPQTQQEDLTIYIYKLDDKSVKLHFTYKESAFEQYVINEMIEHYINILNRALDGYENILDIPFMTCEEEANLAKMNSTDFKRDFYKVCELLSHNAEKYANKVAVSFEGKEISYKEFDDQTDRLASFLKANATHEIIGVCMNRSIELIMCVFGILKAGMVYLPIDPTYPDERIKYMLEDSQVDLLLINSENTKYHFKNESITVIDMANKQYSTFDRISGISILPEDAAYLIYTSGSTGKPKGVINNHAGLYNRVSWQSKALGYSQDTVFIQKTAYSFDVSVWELCLPFTIGAKLVVAKPEGHKDIKYLIDIIKKEQVSTIHFVPSMFEIFLNNPQSKECVSLSTIVCSGEGLSKSVARDCLNKLPKARLFNLYGPTEAAIDVTYCLVDNDNVDKHNIVSIGQPIENTKIYISSSDNKQLPLGVRGELLISGINLADGYYHKPELTSEKFKVNPFYDGNDKAYSRVYHSGDYALRDKNGNIVFIGRMDNQVKVNGQRVELSEIENKTREVAKLKEVKVLVKKVGTIEYLVSYYSADSDIDVMKIKNRLKEFLPAYMVPSSFIRLDAFPLTPNGKLNVSCLQELPFEPPKNKNIIAPQNEEERLLLNLFKEILQRDDIGIESDFFESGGDSLRAIQLISEYNKTTLDKVYKYKTVRKIIETNNQILDEGILKPLKLTAETKDAINIIYVPYGGGNPYVFTNIAEYISDANQYAVDLPGHHFGDDDSQLMPPDEIAKMCVQSISDKKLNNLYIYGHCTGASIAYAICRLLENDPKVNVRRLIVGAVFPFFNEEDKIAQGDYKGALGKEEAFQFIRSLGGFKDEKIQGRQREEIINWFMYDAAGARNYFGKLEIERPKLNVPLICITSKMDFFTEDVKSSIKNWDYLANEATYYSLDEGNHYFIEGQAHKVAEIINSK